MQTSMLRWARVVTLLLAGQVAGATLPLSAQDADMAPRVRDFSVRSLMRAREEWNVYTTIILVAEDADSKEVRFKITGGPSHGEIQKASESPERKSAVYRYQPNIGFVGTDEIHYGATDKTSTATATVRISVERGGLRWEIEADGSTGLSSSESQVPSDILGRTQADFLFKLDWQPLSPRQGFDRDKVLSDAPKFLFPDSTGIESPPMSEKPALARKALMHLETTHRVEPGFSYDVHVVVRAGIMNKPVAVDQTRTDGDQPSHRTLDSKDASSRLAYQRAFTASGELFAAAVRDADGQGSFLEMGAVVRGIIDAFIEGEKVVKTDDLTFITLARPDGKRAFFSGEVGARFTLKQYEEASETDVVMADDMIHHPRNVADLLVFETLYQRSENLAGLQGTSETDSRNRLVVRFSAFPKIPNMSAGRFVLGLEVNRAFGGGPQDVRVLYGINVMPAGLF
ncbi:MAG: hypothetical protein HYX75_14070 [Acidobacteria bacterium]|nr:hypothetical protein [Acidobacteriota bacterium]